MSWSIGAEDSDKVIRYRKQLQIMLKAMRIHDAKMKGGAWKSGVAAGWKELTEFMDIEPRVRTFVSVYFYSFAVQAIIAQTSQSSAKYVAECLNSDVMRDRVYGFRDTDPPRTCRISSGLISGPGSLCR